MMQTAERTRFTEAEMATVRDTDLPDLLISLGYQVKRIGRYYTTQEMDSIRIKDRRTWFRYSEGIGGDAITFLQRFYNKSFPEAVEYLLTWHGRARDSPPVSTPRQTKEKEEKVPFNAKRKELRHLYDYHPNLWERMLELQALPNKVSEKFNRSETFSDIDAEFRLEDAQESLFQNAA